MAITMAFQPIGDIETGAVFAYEALVRGVDGQLRCCRSSTENACVRNRYSLTMAAVGLLNR